MKKTNKEKKIGVALRYWKLILIIVSALIFTLSITFFVIQKKQKLTHEPNIEKKSNEMDKIEVKSNGATVIIEE